MKAKIKKLIIILTVITIIFGGAYFVLGGYGSSGPSSAPNLAEYGLVGYWNMEEGKGQTVYDRSGNGNNGTLGASTAVGKDDPVFTSGYSSAGAGGTALKFDGKDDWVDAGDIQDLNSATAFTISGWVKQTSNTSFNRIFSKFIDASNDILFSSYQSRLYFEVGNGTNVYGYWNDYSSNIPSGQWFYATAVFNGSGSTNPDKMKLYVNGIKRNMVFSGTAPSATANLSGYNFSIGRTLLSGDPFFSGSIDEVRIYNRALSADEIRQHYNQKKPILELKMDEGSGTTTKDDSFNNNDATFPAADANKPTWSSP